MREYSTLEFRSNLQPIIDNDWSVVRSSVMDPFALEQMHNKGIRLTDAQEQQYQDASLHCAYAFPGDYPWGTIYNEDGLEKHVCKCANVKCSLFNRCRPDFNPDELDDEVAEFNEEFIKEFSGRNAFTDKENILPDIIFSPKPVAVIKTSSAETTELPQTEISRVSKATGDVKKREPAKSGILGKISGLQSLRVEKPEGKKTVVTSDGFDSFVDVPQEQVVSAALSDRMLVNAGPGTGKTWTLIERIIYLINNEESDPQGIMILCFSRAAVEVVEERLLDAYTSGRIGDEYNLIDIRTFDSFCTFVISWAMQDHPELLPAGYSLENQDYDARIRTATEIIHRKQNTLDQYCHLIVDEVQDLVGCRAELVLEMLKIIPSECGFTLLGDACQALYDWQTNDNPGMMSSESFYMEILKNYPDMHRNSFTENHRQIAELAELAIPYRKEILTGSETTRKNIVAQIMEHVSDSGISAQRINADKISEYMGDGSLGILTRTNGQALKISELLNNEGICHTIQRPADDASLHKWIADFFSVYPFETINATMFNQAFSSIDSTGLYYSSGELWNALASTQYGDFQGRYEVEDILKGLLRNGRDRRLYVSNDVDAKITVSNIHRAKGREFDSVLVLEDVLNADDDSNELQEHKVKYVAITRPRTQLATIAMKKQYIYIDKSGSRRCYQSGRARTGNNYLTHIETGVQGDLDKLSFASGAQIQNYIRNELKQGMRLRLIKMPEADCQYIRYRIVPEDNENTTLGFTGKGFALGLERAIQRIKGITARVYFELYPRVFGDVYVDRIVTCVSARTADMAGAKLYGNMAVWHGFTVSGFAHFEKDTY